MNKTSFNYLPEKKIHNKKQIKALKKLLMFFCLYIIPVILSSCAPAKFASEEKEKSSKPETESYESVPVRILMDDGSNDFSFLVSSSMKVLSDQKALAYVNKGNRIEIASAGSALQMNIGGQMFSAPEFRFMSVDDNNTFEFNGKKYRGAIVVNSNKKVVNVVSLEDYLKGVLPAEMPAGKGNENFEALKAQAVCARTYAVMKLNEKKKDFDLYIDVRDQVYGGAESEKEIVFTAGTTASINLVTQTFGRQNIGEGDEIIISHMEHHSNIVPWQLLAKEKKAILKVIPISDAGELDIEAYKKLVTDRTKIVSVVYVSNSLGTINPVKDIIEYAHSFRIPVLIDAAQAVNHFPVNVKELDCDFLALSGHKLFGPTGIGVLYGKEDLLESMPPYMGGGDMISKVTFEETTFNELPHKFEAGTPHIEGVIGLGAAIDYLNNTGLGNISAYESELYEYTYKAISSIKGLNIIGTAQNRCSVISFTLDNVHPHDVGTFLDFEGIAIRTGHHCTQPVMQRFNIPATSRVSLAFYNTKEEVDILVNGIKKVIEVFG